MNEDIFTAVKRQQLQKDQVRERYRLRKREKETKVREMGMGLTHMSKDIDTHRRAPDGLEREGSVDGASDCEVSGIAGSETRQTFDNGEERPELEEEKGRGAGEVYILKPRNPFAKNRPNRRVYGDNNNQFKTGRVRNVVFQIEGERDDDLISSLPSDRSSDCLNDQSHRPHTSPFLSPSVTSPSVSPSRYTLNGDVRLLRSIRQRRLITEEKTGNRLREAVSEFTKEQEDDAVVVIEGEKEQMGLRKMGQARRGVPSSGDEHKPLTAAVSDRTNSTISFSSSASLPLLTSSTICGDVVDDSEEMAQHGLDVREVISPVSEGEGEDTRDDEEQVETLDAVERRHGQENDNKLTALLPL
eukprot:GHVN01076861.1.p1 GENE.GHVN01076861.1~~GHVN01076861.1.p1  ORF type:complete len:358 (+),score=103.99 GHVN01076861.1:335-1408(+)